MDLSMINPEEYVKVVRRPYPPLYIYALWIGQTTTENYADLMKSPSHVHSLIENSKADIYYNKQEIAEVAEAAFQEFQNREGLENLMKVLEKKEQRLLDAAHEDLESYLQAYREYQPAITLVIFPQTKIETRVKELLSEYFKDEAEELFEILATPLRDNFYKQETNDLVRSDDLVTHVKKYEWLNSRYGDATPYTVEEAQKKKNLLNPSEYEDTYRTEKQRIQEALDRVEKTFKPEDKVMIDLMQFVVYYRTQRTDVLNRSSYEAVPMLMRVASENGLSYEEFLHVTEAELMGELPSKDVIHSRIEKHAAVLLDGEFAVLSGSDAAKLDELFNEEKEVFLELSGQVASKGTAKGTARVIYRKHDLEKLQKGDILVTSMTTPDMIAAMEKAAAFVTDEGGITCHAAIISREMKKPCIIGTQKATAVIQDGDQVEVDAMNGIVKKLT